MLSCLYFQAFPSMIWLGVVSSVTPHPEWSPLCSPKHTRIQTTAMTHHSNNVRDHMKWVSGSLFISRITIMVLPCVPSPDARAVFSVTPITQTSPHLLTPCLYEEFRCPLFLLWYTVCVARLDCWAVRRYCPVWPWCKPTTFQPRRRWCHPWVRGTEPVLRATKPIHSTATTTTGTKFTMDNPTTATWAICQLGAVLHWWGRFQLRSLFEILLMISKLCCHEKN